MGKDGLWVIKSILVFWNEVREVQTVGPAASTAQAEPEF